MALINRATFHGPAPVRSAVCLKHIQPQMSDSVVAKAHGYDRTLARLLQHSRSVLLEPRSCSKLLGIVPSMSIDQNSGKPHAF
jgi:hypothetical protein